MTVGDRIRLQRERLGLSQSELAERMGYAGKTSISKAETYGDNVTTTKVKRFAEALHCSWDYLMGWTDDPEDYDRLAAEGEYVMPKDWEGTFEEWVKAKKAAEEDARREHDLLSLLSEDEQDVLFAYRAADDNMKKAIKTILGVKDEENG